MGVPVDPGGEGEGKPDGVTNRTVKVEQGEEVEFTKDGLGRGEAERDDNPVVPRGVSDTDGDREK